MPAATFHAPDAMKQVTVTVRVTGAKELAWRLWLATYCFKIGAWIAGCGIAIERDERP